MAAFQISSIGRNIARTLQFLQPAMTITLTSLPPEITQQIASYLPSASSIISLDLTCRHLHQAISLDDYRLFRGFAQSHFPSIAFPPLWNEAARALTTRSRAWDKKAFVGRVLLPRPQGRPHARADISHGGPRQRLGYAPALDSYEEWKGGKWADREQVVAWGAGAKVVVRKRARIHSTWEGERIESRFWARETPVKTDWAVMSGIEGNESAHDDILDLRLLRQSQRQTEDEHMIIRRANGEVVRLRCNLNEKDFSEAARFRGNDLAVEALDVSHASVPILAVCHPTTLSVFPCFQEGNVSPISSHVRDNGQENVLKGMNLKFLDPTRFVLAEKAMKQTSISPIKVYSIEEDRLSVTSTTTCSPDGQRDLHRYSASVLAPLPSSSRPGANDHCHLFLAGWNDGVIRLHDDRCPIAVSEYIDTVDQGLIASIMPIGHESFVAGGHQNACMKLFDIRMPGSRPYSYLNARPPRSSSQPTQQHPSTTAKPPFARISKPQTPTKQMLRPPNRVPLTDMNILLSLPLNNQTRLYDPHTSTQQPANRARRGQYTRPCATRYNGSIYSLTLPSPSSRTFYAGIENHVLQFDISSTDDIVEGRLDHDWDLGLDHHYHHHHESISSESDVETDGIDSILFQLSGYNRPPPPSSAEKGGDRFISDEKVELRGQISLDEYEGEAPWDRSRQKGGRGKSAGGGGGIGGLSSSSSSSSSTIRRGMREGWDERWRVAESGRRGGSGRW